MTIDSLWQTTATSAAVAINFAPVATRSRVRDTAGNGTRRAGKCKQELT